MKQSKYKSMLGKKRGANNHQKVNPELLVELNQHFSKIYENQRGIAKVAYTSSVLVSVLVNIVQKQLNISAEEFGALVDKELAERKAEAKPPKIETATAAPEEVVFGGDYSEK